MKLPLCSIDPVTVCVPIKAFEPVVANDDVLAFIELVYDNTLALKALNDDVTLYNDAVAASNAPTLPLNDDVAVYSDAVAASKAPKRVCADEV